MPNCFYFISPAALGTSSRQHPKYSALNAALFAAHAGAMSKASREYRPRSLPPKGRTGPPRRRPRQRSPEPRPLQSRRDSRGHSGCRQPVRRATPASGVAGSRFGTPCPEMGRRVASVPLLVLHLWASFRLLHLVSSGCSLGSSLRFFFLPLVLFKCLLSWFAEQLLLYRP